MFLDYLKVSDDGLLIKLFCNWTLSIVLFFLKNLKTGTESSSRNVVGFLERTRRWIMSSYRRVLFWIIV
jgi:hypothetical protein